MRNITSFILLALCLSGCAISKSTAPIEYNHQNSSLGGTSAPLISNEGEVISNGVIENKNSEIITPYNDNDYVLPIQSPKERNRKIIYHEVKVGETIEDIALTYEQTIDEIAMLNDLYPPYYLDEFQIVKIRVPRDFDPSASTANKQVATPQKVGPAYIAPVKGSVLTKFGENTKYGTNKGINIAAKQGTKVTAAAGGKVIYADYDATFGYLVLIKVKAKNIITSYAHLEDIILTKGSSINQGDIVGYVGSTGKVNKPQLHFGIREGKIAKDPLKFVKY